jgi:hypothetical protein
MDQSSIRDFKFKVPETKERLVKEILKRWWYAKDFKDQAQLCFNYSKLYPYMKSKKSKDNEPEFKLKKPYKGRFY